MGLATHEPQGEGEGEGEQGQADEHGAAPGEDGEGPTSQGAEGGQPEGGDEREREADAEDGSSGEQNLQVSDSCGPGGVVVGRLDQAPRDQRYMTRSSIPATWARVRPAASKSSAERKGPLMRRWLTIFSAVTGPIPGNSSSSSDSGQVDVNGSGVPSGFPTGGHVDLLSVGQVSGQV